MRRATPADALSISACVRAAYEPYVARIGKPPGPMLDDYHELIQKERVFVLDWNTDIIGVLVLMQKGNSILLDNVAVHPTYQGRGYGRRLIQFAENEVRRLGFTAIDLYTNVDMTENIKLYQELGYEETARKTVRGYRRVYMRKELRKL